MERHDIYIDKDTTFSEFQSLPRYKEYRNFKYFSCGECIFVDKFGNINFRVYFTIKKYSNHLRSHNVIIKKHCVIMNDIPPN